MKIKVLEIVGATEGNIVMKKNITLALKNHWPV